MSNYLETAFNLLKMQTPGMTYRQYIYAARLAYEVNGSEMKAMEAIRETLLFDGTIDND